MHRAVPLGEEWRLVSYQIFEWPGAPGTFTERIDALRTSIANVSLSWL